MMKPGKMIRRVLLVTAIAAALIALSTCTNPVGEALNSPSFGLVGTWVNAIPLATANPGSCGRLIVNVDGTFRSEDSTGGMVTTGTYTVDSVSVSGNSRTFQVHYVWGISHAYILSRVTGGTLYESVTNGTLPYPTSITTGGPGYMKATLE
jgi:hypothetical protein